MSGAARAVRAEWTKLRTLPSTWWLLLLAFGGMVALAFATTGTMRAGDCQGVCDTVRSSLIGVRLAQVPVAILAVLAVTAEYSSRTIRTTLAAVPRRWAVVGAKLAVVTALAVAVGVLGTAGSMVAGRLLLPHRGFTPAVGYPLMSLADPLTRRAAVGTVLYLGLVALLSAGVGLLLRDTGGSLAVVLLLLLVAPVLAVVLTNPVWQHRLERYSPMNAGLAIQSTRDLATLAIGAWAGVGILAAYAVTLAVAGALGLRFRDA